MPLIKQSNTAPMAKSAIVLDLGDLARQAAQLQAGACAKAEAILAQAQAKAQQLIAEASGKGLELGKAEGLQKGLAEGRAQGHAEALAQVGAQLQQLQQAWIDAAGSWDAQRQAMERDARQAVLELALRLAEKIVRRRVEVDPGAVVDQAAAALTHVLRPLDVSVRLCPDDRPVLEEALPQLAAKFPHLTHVHLVDDPTVGRGGCVVTYGQGQIDATIDTQLRRLVEVLMPETPSPLRERVARYSVSGEGDKTLGNGCPRCLNGESPSPQPSPSPPEREREQDA